MLCSQRAVAIDGRFVPSVDPPVCCHGQGSDPAIGNTRLALRLARRMKASDDRLAYVIWPPVVKAAATGEARAPARIERREIVRRSSE